MPDALRRRPVDRRTASIDATLEEWADAGRLLVWAAGTLRTLPDTGRSIVALLGEGHTATNAELVAERIAQMLAARDAADEADHLEQRRAARRAMREARAAAR